MEEIRSIYKRNDMFHLPTFQENVKKFHQEMDELCQKAGCTRQFLTDTFTIDDTRIFEKGKTYDYGDHTVTYDIKTGERVFKLKETPKR